MIARHTRFLAFLLVSALVLAPAVLAENEQDPPEQKKEEAAPQAESASKPEAAKAADTRTQVSPIYQAAPKPTAKATEDVVVITNEDLDRMWANLPPAERQRGVFQAERHVGDSPEGKSGGESAGGAAEKQPGNALEWEEQQQAQAQEHRDAVSEAENKVAELQGRVQELERHALAQRNPLLPRRYSEKKPDDEEDAKNWRNMDNEQRVDATDAALEKARADLAAAQKELSRLRGSGR